MPQQAPCAGQCGRPIYLSKGSLPAGQATCRACRASRRIERVATCLACGDEFEAQGVAVYCSVICRGSARSPRGVSRHRVCEVCEVCEAPYVASYIDQRTCGRTCGAVLQSESRPPKPVEERKSPFCRIHAGYCQQCGEAFTSIEKRKTCSRRCADRLYDATSRRPRVSSVPHRCTDCGETISNRRNKCDLCRAETSAARKQRERRRRRARKLGVPSEPYALAEIATRDGFRCGLCQKRVDMRCYFPHPEAPTIDHVVPLARGGDDMRANVQLAHFLCNSRKSDRGGGEQLALVG